MILIIELHTEANGSANELIMVGWSNDELWHSLNSYGTTCTVSDNIRIFANNFLGAQSQIIPAKMLGLACYPLPAGNMFRLNVELIGIEEQLVVLRFIKLD